ncbi:cyclase family protein [Deinococcus roseus]|uniref:Cyclase n=1 Tax=Deinococcus roseus TaxID=392414 RepID=A0ABQ2CYR4_9DEIO|nr:cyclase family protein [Deinococcus roseus]GGJ33593.1 hypothetical protein GCM10008938_19800 [Deinococcus roseus]
MDTVRIMGRNARIIDLSDTLSNDTQAFEPNQHDIRYIDHVLGLTLGAQVFGLTLEQVTKAVPRGYAWAVEQVTLSTHSGTHVDAPYHYGPTMQDGTPTRTIDQVPLSWCVGDGVKLDFTSRAAGEGITAQDIKQELSRISCTLKPGDIVLIHTGASRFFKEKGYDQRHAGLTREATQFLVQRGVKLIGIDAWGLDRPFNVTFPEAMQGKTEFWESHFYGLEEEYCQIEKLCNLENIPVSQGFTVMALPYKIQGASSGWTRAVALVPEP